MNQCNILLHALFWQQQHNTNFTQRCEKPFLVTFTVQEIKIWWKNTHKFSTYFKSQIYQISNVSQLSDIPTLEGFLNLIISSIVMAVLRQANRLVHQTLNVCLGTLVYCAQWAIFAYTQIYVMFFFCFLPILSICF